MKSRTIEGVLAALMMTYVLSGCSDKINQTGSWLVSYGNTLTPRYFNSDSDSVNVKSAQVNLGLANGSSSLLCVGKVPWTEARLLIEFQGLDSVYYASTIISAQVIFTRGPNTLQPPGTNVQSLQLAGYTLDTTWNPATYTWDSVSAVPRGLSDIVLSQPPISVNDSSVTIYLDTATVRQWALATKDSNVTNNGFVLIPQNPMGILNVYSDLNTTGAPEIEVACVINGVPDTIISTSSTATFVGQTYPSLYTPNYAAPNTYRLVQGGTGERESITFDLSKIPNYSIVNFAQLTLYADTLDSAYYGHSVDSLYAYYISDPSAYSVNASYYGQSTLIGNRYVINVTTPVQLMLNHGNYGFLIRLFQESSSVDTRIVYDENAPDSLRPKLTVVYSPAGKR